MRGISGSGPFGALAHICWFGQPAQASPFPACCDSGPGQCSSMLLIKLRSGNRSLSCAYQARVPRVLVALGALR